MDKLGQISGTSSVDLNAHYFTGDINFSQKHLCAIFIISMWFTLTCTSTIDTETIVEPQLHVLNSFSIFKVILGPDV